MKQLKLLAGAGVLAALAALLASNALAAGSGPTVTVRVEGLKRTLLMPTRVKLGAGWVTKYGAKKGECPNKTAQGALNVATRQKWVGKWSTEFGPEYEITSILGENHGFSSKDYWEIFINNKAAQSGACEIKATPGQQVLFAAVPDKGAMQVPLRIVAPSSVRVGSLLPVHVSAQARRRVVGIRGATVSGGGLSGRTDSRGLAQLRAQKAGTYVLSASKPGFVRVEVTVRVS